MIAPIKEGIAALEYQGINPLQVFNPLDYQINQRDDSPDKRGG